MLVVAPVQMVDPRVLAHPPWRALTQPALPRPAPVSALALVLGLRALLMAVPAAAPVQLIVPAQRW